MPLEIKVWHGYRLVTADRVHISKYLEMIETEQIDGLVLSPHTGFEGSDLSILQSAPKLKALVLAYSSEYKLGSISNLSNIEYLSIDDSKEAFDSNCFCRLKHLTLGYYPKFVLPESNATLKSIRLWGYTNKTKDLTSLPHYPSLEVIELVQGNLTSLRGIARYTRLQEILISYVRFLQNINELGLLEIEKIEFDKCRKILDFSILANCKELRKVFINNCMEISTIKFIENLHALSEFRFVNTRVLDGNIEALLNMKNLIALAFTDHRDYAYKLDEIKKKLDIVKI